jgi:hypothetical protein
MPATACVERDGAIRHKTCDDPPVSAERRPTAWVGGLAMLTIYLLPPLLLGITGSPDSLRTNGLDYGALLCAIPGILAAVLLVPLIGYRRRHALWLLVPLVGFYVAWDIGARAAVLGSIGIRRADPHPLGERNLHPLGRST